jgi:hypothetical protein
MIGSGAAVVRRRYSPQVFAALLASSLIVLSAPFWVHQASVAQSNLQTEYAQGSLAQGSQSQRSVVQKSTAQKPINRPINQRAIQASTVLPGTSLLPVGNSAEDPLNSPYPIPWNTIWEHQTQATQSNRPETLYYLSPPLRSPDRQILAHTKIEIKIDPDFRRSHIFSQLILKTAQGKILQTIPSSMHLGRGNVQETAARQTTGTIAILVPAAWSKNGQRLLSRQFEAVFGSDVLSDYAVIWERNHLQTKTVTPLPLNYDSATLLGWSQNHPDQLLFRTATLGETSGSTLAVDHRGTTIASPNDRALPQYGQASGSSEKSQAHR